VKIELLGEDLMAPGCVGADGPDQCIVLQKLLEVGLEGGQLEPSPPGEVGYVEGQQHVALTALLGQAE
jgi:hypothetical protein